MFQWFRPSPLLAPSPYRTALAMVDARAGDQILVIGAGDAGLASELALVAGLNGGLVVVDDAAGAAARVEAAAAAAGALVDFKETPVTGVPIDDASVDVVVIARRLETLADRDRIACAAEARRVLKPGGRLMAIEGPPPARWFDLWRRTAPALASDEVRAVLERAGWNASRVVAAVDGTTYVEAIKPRV
jgi:ubiquinone/menaquinone biosynthesis C-methylase UbiE